MNTVTLIVIAGLVYLALKGTPALHFQSAGGRTSVSSVAGSYSSGPQGTRVVIPGVGSLTTGSRGTTVDLSSLGQLFSGLLNKNGTRPAALPQDSGVTPSDITASPSDVPGAAFDPLAVDPYAVPTDPGAVATVDPAFVDPLGYPYDPTYGGAVGAIGVI